jgi:hypothetical protein
MIDNRHAILNHSDRASYQRYVEALPLISLARRFGYWVQESVNSACVLDWRFRLLFLFYLNLLAAPQ